MSISEKTSRAFDQCFDAALGLADWPTALQALGEALGADSSVLRPSGQYFSERRRVQIESTEHASFSDLRLARIEDPLSDPHSVRPKYHPVRRFSSRTTMAEIEDDIAGGFRRVEAGHGLRVLVTMTLLSARAPAWAT